MSLFYLAFSMLYIYIPILELNYKTSKNIYINSKNSYLDKSINISSLTVLNYLYAIIHGSIMGVIHIIYYLSDFNESLKFIVVNSFYFSIIYLIYDIYLIMTVKDLKQYTNFILHHIVTILILSLTICYSDNMYIVNIVSNALICEITGVPNNVYFLIKYFNYNNYYSSLTKINNYLGHFVFRVLNFSILYFREFTTVFYFNKIFLILTTFIVILNLYWFKCMISKISIFDINL